MNDEQQANQAKWQTQDIANGYFLFRSIKISFNNQNLWERTPAKQKWSMQEYIK